MKEIEEKFKKVIIPLIVAYVLVMLFLIPAIVVTSGYNNTVIPGTEASTISPAVGNFRYAITNPFFSIGQVLQYPILLQMYFTYFKLVTIIFVMILGYLVLIKKWKKTGKWEKIEHGSAGWAEKGEQYKILSKTEGILLAKDHYLPVDKTGNVNVLVVGGSGSRKVIIIC